MGTARIGIHHEIDDDGSWHCLVKGMEPLGLNRLLRLHWRVRGRMQDELELILRSAGPTPCFKGPVLVTYTRSYYRVPMDDDNLSGSFKLIGDALVALKIVEDDKPKILKLNPFQIPRAKFGPRFRLSISRREP